MGVAGRGHHEAAQGGHRSDDKAAVRRERGESAEDLADPGLGDRGREPGEVASETGQDFPVR